MSDPTLEALIAEIATLQAQLSWANASILQLVDALELLNRSVHEFDATHPATASEQVLLLLQQIRKSRPGSDPGRPPPLAPQSPPRRRNQRRHTGSDPRAG
jgi:hypothetical protein